jgi:hypothetical protein
LDTLFTMQVVLQQSVQTCVDRYGFPPIILHFQNQLTTANHPENKPCRLVDFV